MFSALSSPRLALRCERGCSRAASSPRLAAQRWRQRQPASSLGFHVPPLAEDDQAGDAGAESEAQHKAAFGLSARQMAVLYPEFSAPPGGQEPEDEMEQKISARASYLAPLATVTAPTRKPPTASTAAPQVTRTPKKEKKEKGRTLGFRLLVFF